MRTLTRIFLRILCFATPALLLWSIALPLYIDLLGFGVLFAIVAFATDAGLVLFSMSSSLSLLTVAAGISHSAFPIRGYYREHELYARGRVYKAQVVDRIDMPHGDLAAVDPSMSSEVIEPRVVEFRTDSRGYRNDVEYAGQKDILLGDSFVVGNGTTQSEILPSALRRCCNRDSYSLGFPSDPFEYEQRAAWFLDAVEPKVRFSFFFYEGNDFRFDPPPGSSRSSLLRSFMSLLDRYDALRFSLLDRLGPPEYSKIIYKLGRRAEARFFLRGENGVLIRSMAGGKGGFLIKDTVPIVAPRATVEIEALPWVTDRTACVFFVPTKARVYNESFDPPLRFQLLDEPSAIRELRRVFDPLNIPVVDLTAALRRAAQHRSRAGEAVFWRDDTHWNGNGVAAVAPIIDRCLKEHEESPLRAELQFPRIERVDGTLTVDGRTYVLDALLRHAIEGIDRNEMTAYIRGWVIHGAESIHIIAVRGNSMIGRTAPRFNRPELENGPSRSERPSGFMLGIPLGMYADGDSIELYALTSDGRAARLTPPAG